VIVIVLIAGFFTYSWYKNRFLNQTLKEKVVAESKGLYRIDYDNMAVDEAAGELFVTNVRVYPDTAFLDHDGSSSDNPGVLLSVTASRIHVTGVETPKALLNKEIRGRKLVIADAKVEIFLLNKKDTGDIEPDSSAAAESLAEKIYREVLKDLEMVSVDTIALDHVDFSFKDYDTKKLIMSSSDLNIKLYDVLIDERAGPRSDKILFAENMELFADSVRLRDKKNNYNFLFSSIGFSSAKKEINIKTADIEPRKDEQEFVEQFKTQKDRFDFEFRQVSIKQVDIGALAGGALFADSLLVGRSSFKIYRDLNIPRDKLIRVGGYPHQMIMKVPFDLQIKTGVFNNSFIEYKERNDKTGKPGRVRFNNSSAVMENITNVAAAIRKNGFCTIYFKSSFLNMAAVNLKLKMRLGDKQGRFTLNGELGAFDAKNINALTEPMGLARIERGRVQKLSFQLNGDNYTGSGTVTVLYDDLKISALKFDDNEYKKKGLASIVANVIVKNKNPQGGNTRKAGVNYQRNTNRSFFNLIWKSIFAGVKETVGMDPEEKKK
jgi:hypothetical protein